MANEERVAAEIVDQKKILNFAILVTIATFIFFFLAAFPPTFVNPNEDVIKLILPFLFSTASGLWGYYWGSSKGSQEKSNTIDTAIQTMIPKASMALAPKIDWKCPTCDTENICEAYFCKNCGTIKPDILEREKEKAKEKPLEVIK